MERVNLNPAPKMRPLFKVLLSIKELQENKSSVLITTVFIAGLLLRLALSFNFESFYLSEAFIPFSNLFLSKLDSSVYSILQSHPDGFEYFPYPGLMLYIVSAFNTVSSIASTPQVSQGLFKSLFILFDLFILLILVHWSRNLLSTLILYWLSPLVLYINYVHGQLDIIPTSFLLLSSFFLFKQKFKIAAIAWGLAISTKLHILVSLPVFILYIFSRERRCIKVAGEFVIITALTFLFFNSIFIRNPDFVTSIMFNSQQSSLTVTKLYFSSELSLYLLPFSYILAIFWAWKIKEYNRNIFLFFLGISYSILLLLVPPSQGRYMWVYPFFTYFYVTQKNIRSNLLILLQALFLFYFFSESSQHLPFFSPKLTNLSFSVLQAVLLLNCIYIYMYGLKDLLSKKVISKTFSIGIGGNSGAGKTTLCHYLVDVFSNSNSLILRGDDMHKWERGDKNWSILTHLNPKANNLHEEVHQIKNLLRGKKISRRSYDHSNGKFTSPTTLKPARILFMEGLHPFYISQTRKLFDLKIFVSPATELQNHWKVLRDIKKRGYSKEKILEQIKHRENDFEKHIKTQEKHADITISFKPLSPINQEELGESSISTNTYLDIKLKNSIFIEKLEQEYKSIQSGLKLIHDYTDSDHQTITLKSSVSQDTNQKVAQKLLPNFEELGYPTPQWKEGDAGFLQVLICFCIFSELELLSN